MIGEIVVSGQTIDTTNDQWPCWLREVIILSIEMLYIIIRLDHSK